MHIFINNKYTMSSKILLFCSNAINVLNFTLFNEFDYVHSCFLLREINNPEYVLTDHVTLHFLELTKLEDIIKDDKQQQ